MKKLLSLTMALVMLISLINSSMITSYGKNDCESANLNVNYKYTYDWDNDDFSHYYKFVPKKSGSYTAKIYTNDKKVHNDDGAIALTLQDSNGYDIEWSNWNGALLSATLTYELKANKTYYYYVECWQDQLVELSFNIQEHHHNLVESSLEKSEFGYNGYVEYECSQCDYYKSSTIPSVADPKLSKTTYTYDGKTKKPTVTIKDSKGNKLVKGTDYSVKYASGCKNVGKYKVNIKLKGKYTGSKNLYFTINPKSTAISSITAQPKAFIVKWKKQATQTTGYQLQYATNSKFSSAKTVTVSSNKTTSKSIEKLSGKKKYYVRIRTYKVVNGKKFYSDWSKAKSVTTKPAVVTTKPSSNSSSGSGSSTASKPGNSGTSYSGGSSSSGCVYITPTGKKYHYDNHCNGGTYIKSTMSEAKSRGLTPCKKCVY